MTNNKERTIIIVHLLVILAGLILLVSQFGHDQVWFDEAYSVAIAQHSFADIWAIGATDVHPVLYYWMLHCVYLVFGPNIVAFRMLSVVGMVVLSLLGFTHIRKDFGAYCGLFFSILVFLVPWSVYIAEQIRMYAWLSVFVMVAAIYAWRIVQALYSQDGKIKSYWWAILALTSLAAAYLQYFGAIAAFVIQLMVLVSLVRSTVPFKKTYLSIWAGLALIVLLLYAPWLISVGGQIENVTSGFWITIEFPLAFYQLVLFPFYESVKNDADTFLSNSWVVYCYLAVIALEIACAFALGRMNSGKDTQKGFATRFMCHPIPFFLIIYFGTFGIAALASACIGQPILYFRYLTAALGPVLLVIACALSRLRGKAVARLSWLVIVLLALYFYQVMFLLSADQKNDEAIEGYEAITQKAQQLNGGEAPLIFSGDEGLVSIVAVETDGTPIMYTNPLTKYRAFEPRFTVDEQWASSLDGYDGMAVYIGYDDAVRGFVEEHGGVVIETESYFHPYSDRWLVYHLIDYSAEVFAEAAADANVAQE